MKRYDIALDKEFNLLFEGGDFKLEPSDENHASLIFLAQRGEYKKDPLLGFGAVNSLKNNELIPADIQRELSLALAYDGYDRAEVSVDDHFKITLDI